MKLPRLNGTQGLVILLFSVALIVRGITYFDPNLRPEALPTGIIALTRYIPLEYWAIGFIACGVVGTVYSFIWNDTVGAAIIVIPFGTWATVYFIGFIILSLNGEYNRVETFQMLLYIAITTILIFWNGRRKKRHEVTVLERDRALADVIFHRRKIKVRKEHELVD